MVFGRGQFWIYLAVTDVVVGAEKEDVLVVVDSCFAVVAAAVDIVAVEVEDLEEAALEDEVVLVVVAEYSLVEEALVHDALNSYYFDAAVAWLHDATAMVLVAVEAAVAEAVDDCLLFDDMAMEEAA